MKVASLSDWLFERLEAPPDSRYRFALARRESLFSYISRVYGSIDIIWYLLACMGVDFDVA